MRISRRHYFGLAVTAAAAVNVALALAARRNGRSLDSVEPLDDEELAVAGVSVLVPLRNEDDNAAGLVETLAQQTNLSHPEFLLLDDNSSDRTWDTLQQESHGQENFRLLPSRSEPPAGWLGKPYACHRLAEAARGKTLVFVDADVRLDPTAVAAAASYARRKNTALVSPWPRQLPTGFLGPLIQPLQQWSWLTTVSRRVSDLTNLPVLAVANGQFLVIDRTAYLDSGGHRAKPKAVLDDMELARTMRRAGYSTEVVDASRVAACQMYATDAELVDGYAKSLWLAFGGPVRGILTGLALTGLSWLPVLAALRGRRITKSLGVVGVVAQIDSRITAATQTGGSIPAAYLHPVSTLVLDYLLVISLRRRRQGQLSWRGRSL